MYCPERDVLVLRAWLVELAKWGACVRVKQTRRAAHKAGRREHRAVRAKRHLLDLADPPVTTVTVRW